MRRRQILAEKSKNEMVETVKMQSLICRKCGYKAKNTTGLAAHIAHSKNHKDDS